MKNAPWIIVLSVLINLDASAQSVRLNKATVAKIADVNVVEGITGSFVKSRGRRKDDYQQPAAWHLVLLKQQNPDVFTKLSDHYSTMGYSDRLEQPYRSYQSLVENFYRYHLERKTKLPWRNFRLNPFEKAKAYRQFVESTAALTDSVRAPIPQRIGILRETKMARYDPDQRMFPVAATNNPPFPRSVDSGMVYEFEMPPEPVIGVPAEPSEAAMIQSKMRNQQMDVLVSFEMVGLQPNPDTPGGVRVQLRNQRTDFYQPGNYEQPVHSRTTQSYFSNPLEGEGGDRIGETSQQVTGSKSNPVIRRMKELSRDLRLFHVDGIPVVGSLKRIGLPAHIQTAALAGQQRLADRLTLAEFPGVFDPNYPWDMPDLPIKMFRRLLGDGPMSPYLDGSLRAWRGDDEFEKRDSMERFFDEQTPTLKQMAIRPPVRLRTMQLVAIGEYEFGEQQFSLQEQDHRFYPELNFGIDDLGDVWFRQRTMPVTYSLAKKWKLPPDQAKKVAAATTQAGRDRAIYQSVVFDVVGSFPYLNSESDVRIAATRYAVDPVDARMYGDPQGKNFLGTLPIDAPVLSVVAGGDKKIPERSGPIPLGLKAVNVCLLELAGHHVSEGDWGYAADSIVTEDEYYYSRGSHPSYQIPESQRRDVREKRKKRWVKEEGFMQWSKDFQPYFPQGYLQHRSTGYEQVRSTLIDEDRIKSLRTMTKSWIKRSGGEFVIEASISYDSETEVVTIDPGYQWSKSSLFSRLLPKDADYGHVAYLRGPGEGSTTGWRSVNATEFSIALPAIEERLTFALAAEDVPSAMRDAGPEDDFVGQMVMRLQKIERPPPQKSQNVAVIHVRPIRFEYSKPSFIEQTVGSEAPPIEFSLQFTIEPFTKADQKAEIAARIAAKEEAEREEKRRANEVIEARRRKQLEDYERKEEKARERVKRESAERERIESELAERERLERLARQAEWEALEVDPVYVSGDPAIATAEKLVEASRSFEASETTNARPRWWPYGLLATVVGFAGFAWWRRRS